MILFHGTNTDIETMFLDQQYYFGSEKALRYLKKSKVQIL